MRMADLHTLEVNPSTLSVNFYHPCQFDGYTDIDLQVRYIVTCIFFYPFPQCFSHNRMVDGWMDDLQFYVLFNITSIISGR